MVQDLIGMLVTPSLNNLERHKLNLPGGQNSDQGQTWWSGDGNSQDLLFSLGTMELLIKVSIAHCKNVTSRGSMRVVRVIYLFCGIT